MVTCAGRQPACSMGKQSVDFSVLASGRGLTKCGNDAVLFSKRHRHFFGGGAKSSSPFFFGRFFCFFFFGDVCGKIRAKFFLVVAFIFLVDAFLDLVLRFSQKSSSPFCFLVSFFFWPG